MRRTREDKARFFGFVEDLSRHVITMGIVTLMEARQCLLRDFGESGTAATAEGGEGPLAASGPAPNLQMHPSAKDCLSAAARFTRRDYYQWVRENKPEWRHVEIY